ncbi:MAG: FAD-dependent oxidoreductase [Candidatus Thermoplasmatota archaeon]|nr:FAD-dependent oxidoreductase [Candidatus Thermoplasmatota archaeon]
MTRTEDLKKASSSDFDALVIGGGIIGSGVANALSQSGIRVILVEKGDYGSGTSSKSSKLIHGGLRYLAQGRIKLTRNLLKERNYLLKHSDVVRKENFDILVGKGQFRKFSIRVGLMLYGLLGGGKPSRFIKNQGEYPGDVKGYFSYTDCVTDDAYLTVMNIVSAHENGATCLNYVSFQDLERLTEGVRAHLVDVITGSKFNVSAKIIINCAGAWIHGLLPGKAINPETTRLSKGIHLIYPRSAFPKEHSVAFKSPIDGRQMFVIPRERVVIAGTTDTFTNTPDDLDVSDEERSYVIRSCSFVSDSFGKVLPIGEYAGIRTLYGAGSSPGKLSRDFKVVADDISFTVVGGKVTDYRRVAFRVAKLVSSRIHVGKVSPEVPRLDYPGHPWHNDIESAINHECAMTLNDILQRRFGTYYFDPEKLEEVSKQIHEFLEKKNIKMENGFFIS